MNVDLNRVITLRDIRSQKISPNCAGAVYFLKNQGMTMEDVRRGKLTVGKLLETGDAMARNFVEKLNAN